MLNIILVATLALSASTFPTTNPGCFCAVPLVPKAVEGASAVFVGEVIDIVEPHTTAEEAPLPGRLYTVKFKVRKSWKGVTTDEVAVLTAQGKYHCFAYPPVKKGEKYLVYADRPCRDGVIQPDWLIITTCNRTALIPDPKAAAIASTKTSSFNGRDATEDLKELEEISKPILWQ